MALLGRLHPLLVHFPIALMVVAAMAEAIASVTNDCQWRVIAVTNLRAAAVFGVAAAIAGWRLAMMPGAEATATLDWHRWLGATAALATVAAAFASAGADGRSSIEFWVYRVTLLMAAALIAVTGHLGGVLVWGADFLRP